MTFSTSKKTPRESRGLSFFLDARRASFVRRLVYRLLGQSLIVFTVFLFLVVFYIHERLYGVPLLALLLGVVLVNLLGLGLRLAWGDG